MNRIKKLFVSLLGLFMYACDIIDSREGYMIIMTLGKEGVTSPPSMLVAINENLSLSSRCNRSRAEKPELCSVLGCLPNQNRVKERDAALRGSLYRPHRHLCV